ncbi:hypothetical protein TetV_419 [Tetraselmis virus 1]|uniref:Uncharacterized protein n=1 Tax=Tetraselmis virus 1 TaxID=2060617 RepID=A0A2P0VNM6_9VIRU|nr:hypothetical protein QJ968_gp635 [Tetraselmis virus 1]AUF82501.1 hypothetical protein TetV_419 [Tetraselmis virus 1]
MISEGKFVHFSKTEYSNLKPGLLSLFFGKDPVRKYTYEIKGLQIRPGFVYRFIDYNQFEDHETEIPEGYSEIEISEKIVTECYYGDKKVIDNVPIIPEKRKNDDYSFIGEDKYLIYMNNNNVSLYQIPLNYRISQSLKNSCGSPGELRGIYQEHIKTWQNVTIVPIISNNTNSDMLLNIKSGKYVFIGLDTYQFKLIDKTDPISFCCVSSDNKTVAFSKNTVYILTDITYTSKSKYNNKQIQFTLIPNTKHVR